MAHHWAPGLALRWGLSMFVEWMNDWLPSKGRNFPSPGISPSWITTSQPGLQEIWASQRKFDQKKAEALLCDQEVLCKSNSGIKNKQLWKQTAQAGIMVHHLPAVKSWVSHLTYLCFSFLISKVGINTASECVWKNSFLIYMKCLAHSKHFITTFYYLYDNGVGVHLGLHSVNKREVTKCDGWRITPSQWCLGMLNQVASPVTKIRRKKIPPTSLNFSYVCVFFELVIQLFLLERRK